MTQYESLSTYIISIESSWLVSPPKMRLESYVNNIFLIKKYESQKTFGILKSWRILEEKR